MVTARDSDALYLLQGICWSDSSTKHSIQSAAYTRAYNIRMRWSASFPDLFNANRLGTRLKMGSKLEGEGTIHVVAVMFTLPEDVGSLIRALTVFQV